MLDSLTYCPRDARFKQPFGAVPSGTRVSFTLRPPRGGGFSRAVLTARFEFRGDALVEVPMPWTDTELGRDVFTGALETGDYIGLVFYSFRLYRLDGRSEASEEYQLTVYNGAESVPRWFGEGLSYQIFPDRFRRTNLPDPTGMVGGRTLHQDWAEGPEYRPDEKGEIRNRDFFGGSLAGVREKLSYLQSMGVETLYFCPVFEAAENHRYGTGDYEKIDPMLGTNEEFSALAQEAHALGMHVLLDGVFNHSGYVSRYFNGDGAYPSLGAAQSQESPYYPWYNFRRWPDQYEAWWGVYSLPAVNESEPSYLCYMIEDEQSIVRRWLRAGADGWRLDVADELPDSFVGALHAAARQTKPDAVVIGEVWEDGSNKVAYGIRRRHILGGYCDGLMNYPFRDALIAYLLGGDAAQFRQDMELLRENYPHAAYYSAMNFLGTHDTPRILTLLGMGSACTEQTRQWRAEHRMDGAQRARGKALLRLGVLVLMTFPGSPTIYYGDEAGMEGFEDPFNRCTFPWGNEDTEITSFYAVLGRARQTLDPLRRGDISYVKAEGRLLVFARTLGEEKVIVAVNAGEKTKTFFLPWPAVECLSGTKFEAGLAVLPGLRGGLFVQQ